MMWERNTLTGGVLKEAGGNKVRESWWNLEDKERPNLRLGQLVYLSGRSVQPSLHSLSQDPSPLNQSAVWDLTSLPFWTAYKRIWNGCLENNKEQRETNAIKEKKAVKESNI